MTSPTCQSQRRRRVPLDRVKLWVHNIIYSAPDGMTRDEMSAKIRVADRYLLDTAIGYLFEDGLIYPGTSFDDCPKWYPNN